MVGFVFEVKEVFVYTPSPMHGLWILVYCGLVLQYKQSPVEVSPAL
jgi:hypothetical protein